MDISILGADANRVAEHIGRLSIDLFTYTRRLRSNPNNLDVLSGGVASTGAVLKELSQTFSDKAVSRFYSQEGIRAASILVKDVKTACASLETIISDSSSVREKERKERTFNQQSRLHLLEERTEQIQTKLEGLKLSLLLILNILIFAEQLRNRDPISILKDQRELIRALNTEKEENDERSVRFDTTGSPRESAVRPDSKSSSHYQSFDSEEPRPKLIHARTFSLDEIGDRFVTSPLSSPSLINIKPVKIPNLDIPASLKHHYERIQHHSFLVGGLLSQVSSLRYKLDHGTRDRMQNGILNLHWNEWSRYRSLYGQEVFDQMLINHDEIARYWTDQLIKSELSSHSPRENLPPFEFPISERAPISPAGRSFGLGIDTALAEHSRHNTQVDSPSSREPYARSEQQNTHSVDRNAKASAGPRTRNAEMEGSYRPQNQRQRSTTLQTPWQSEETGERRPSIEVTAPEYHRVQSQQPDAIDVRDVLTRSAFNISTVSSSPGTSGAQTPISPSEITPTRRLSYERLRSPTNSTQTSPAASPALRQATLRSARASSGDIEGEVSRIDSRTGGTRPRNERTFSGNYDEELLSPTIARRGSVKDKGRGSGILKLKDPLGRKFKCPIEKCSTWEDMHSLIEAQFFHYPELLPEVQADEYDLFTTDGQRITISGWTRTVSSGVRVTMLLRYGSPEAGFRKKDCLLPFDGDEIVVPEMLHYMTKQDPHNAYRTKLIPPAKHPIKEKRSSVEDDLHRRTSAGEIDAGRSAHHERQPSRTSETSLFVLDEVDRLVLRLTTIRQSELKMIRWDEDSTDS